MKKALAYLFIVLFGLFVAACSVPCEDPTPCGAESHCDNASQCHDDTPYCVHNVCQRSPTAAPPSGDMT